MDTRKLAPLALALPLSLMVAAPANATEDLTFQGNLGQINDSGTTGQVWVKIQANQAVITINVNGGVPDAPHAQHIHIGGEGVCPPPDADQDGDGVVSATEGQPFYGEDQVALTLEEDSSRDSALAVDRMPAGADYTYERTIEVSDQVIQGLSDGKASVVVHGVDLNGDGEYSGEAKSDLDPELPLEATSPAACGELAAAPQGGMETGEGGRTDQGAGGALAAVGGALMAAATAGVFAIRRLRSNV